jgi:hypothetical protein
LGSDPDWRHLAAQLGLGEAIELEEARSTE